MPHSLMPGYSIRTGSTKDRALLLEFMERSYQEILPQQDFSHLRQTVERYLSKDTPLWWVEEDQEVGGDGGEKAVAKAESSSSPPPISCLWVGNAIDQIGGTRHAHIFLIYVVPAHRRRGIGTTLMRYVENWATQRGDRQIGLQVFQSNQAALNLYKHLGYQTQSLWMVKSLQEKI